ncbi:MAG: ParA family protein [Balneolales bacterium]|nr:ParA family protein [Balneolales bacterium]
MKASGYQLSNRELSKLVKRSKSSEEFRTLKLPDGYKLTLNGKIPPLLMREMLEKAGMRFPFKTIAHLNMRGGIGKTTATVSLGARASQYGFKTCIVDLDPQASATYSLCQPSDDQLVTADIWESDDPVPDEALIKLSETLDLLPSSLDNSVLEDEWNNPEIQKTAVVRLINRLKQRGYDLILFDAPPSLNCIVISIIAAVRIVVVPVWSDPFSLRGLGLIFQEAQQISRAFKLSPPDLFVLYAKYDGRLNITRQVYREIDEKYPGRMLNTIIRTSTEFSKAAMNGKSVFKRGVSNPATQDYDAYTRELLKIPIPSPF